MRGVPPRAAHAAIFAASVALSPSAALADDFQWTRTARLVEQSHHVDLTLDRGHAELVVRRSVHNGGPKADQAVFLVDLPDTAVATGLRTLGTLGGRPFWFVGELMEAEEAARKYRELTGIGGAYPKDPALLSWRSLGRLELQVFPVPSGERKTVEYSLQIPTEYVEGVDTLELTRLGTEEVAAAVTVRAARVGDRLLVDGKRAKDGAVLLFDGDRASYKLGLERGSPRPVDGALASVTFGEKRHLVRFRFEASRLSEPPRGAHVVVAIDASRSIDDGAGTAAKAAATAMLGHLPDAKVAVITFDREVRTVHRGFVSVGQATTDLQSLRFVRRNGSRIDDALERADALLAEVPKGTPRRVLLLTDLLARAELDPERLRPLPRSGALLHVAVVNPGTPSLERDDDDPWAKPARSTGGLLWNAGATTESDEADEMKRVYEEWARPLRIDRLTVAGSGMDEDALDTPERLNEGEGIERLGIVPRHAGAVTLQGELWSRPIRKQLVPDARESSLWAAAVFGTYLVHDLSEPEMMVLARRGNAVSPVTSFLAIEPGVRPSTEGLEQGGLGLSGFGEGGGGRGEGIGLGSISGPPPFDHVAFLRNALLPAWRACGGAAAQAKIEIETTHQELVHVPSVRVANQPPASKLGACLERAAWELDLSDRFDAQHARWTVEL